MQITKERRFQGNKYGQVVSHGLAIEISWLGFLSAHLGHSNDNMTASAAVFNLSHTADLGTVNREQDDGSIAEFKHFNIAITSLALCILTATGIFCSFSYCNKRRQLRQAREYENTVVREKGLSPVDIKGLKRTHSLRNPFNGLMRKADDYKDGSQIYFIYSNPIVITEEQNSVMPEDNRVSYDTIQLHEQKQSAGIILDPSMFYMQL
ncbi:uncharacterized protein si:dkey-246e1.3 [Erpetoichthys calabaricus]|uniref:uncharacterized protein si:dkey-246e1.3 n=1 Tax=Erpetoichthys calabaricus TaxID=27687 RepID=UPI002234A142|nr:uncharacterized protein si:dkey-246e1.3 [Erpetoichthys calabaricus]